MGPWNWNETSGMETWRHENMDRTGYRTRTLLTSLTTVLTPLNTVLTPLNTVFDTTDHSIDTTDIATTVYTHTQRGQVEDTVFSILFVLCGVHSRESSCNSTEQLLYIVAGLGTSLNEHNIEVCGLPLSLFHRYLPLVLRQKVIRTTHSITLIKLCVPVGLFCFLPT